MLQQLVLFSCLFYIFSIVATDCGCNKLNRESTEKSSEEKTSNVDEKICQQKQQINKNYRDYYDESAKNTAQQQVQDEPEIEGMSLITGGDYYIGTNEPHFKEDAEAPERQVQLNDFYIDKHELSNAKFMEFVKATNYTTEAEKFGDSFLFQDLLTEEMQKEYEDYRVVNALWWYKVKGVNWKHPNGPDTDLTALWQHPVVHVSWNDARAYCQWAGKRLPTEEEWEAACRGGRERKLFPWGNKLMPNEEHWLNIWQGEFPHKNTKEDGYVTTCPVDKFRQNKYDLYNMVGNVWEWTENSWQPDQATDSNSERVKKGGSYLCNKSYCYRYRCAARSHNTADSSAGNLGFRCAKDLSNKI